MARPSPLRRPARGPIIQRAPSTAAGAPFAGRPVPFVLHYVRRRPVMYLGMLALEVSAAACAVGVQYGMKLLVDAMSVTGEVSAVWTALALFIGLIGIESLLWRCSGWLGARTIVATGVDVRLDLFDHLAGHSARFFSNHLTGALGGRIAAVAGATGAIVSTLAWNIAPPVTDFLGALVIMMTIDWRLAMALIVFVAVIGGGLSLYGTRGHQVHQAYAAQAAEAGGELIDTVANVGLVKMFAARSRKRHRLAARFAVEAAAQRRSWMFIERTRVLHDGSLWLMAALMLAGTIHLWTQGKVTPGDVVVVSALTFRILHGARDVALALAGLTRELAAIADTLAVVAQPHDVRDGPAAKALAGADGTIEFRDVHFAHPGKRPLFNGVSFRIPSGQRIGIVGPSGAGKSTLIALIQRWADVDHGAILIDGQDVALATQDSVRRAIAVVPQEVSLFHRTILENIRYGRPEASDGEVAEAARLAFCHEFITALPEGYGSLVGERGIKLSDGQRQRLALARAILKQAPILLLDEATSALDTESELAIQRSLTEPMRGRTVLAVAHRPSTIAAFDRILVVADGRIVEDGPPELLRRSGSVFEAMWRLQARGLA